MHHDTSIVSDLSDISTASSGTPNVITQKGKLNNSVDKVFSPVTPEVEKIVLPQNPFDETSDEVKPDLRETHSDVFNIDSPDPNFFPAWPENVTTIEPEKTKGYSRKTASIETAHEDLDDFSDMDDFSEAVITDDLLSKKTKFHFGKKSTKHHPRPHECKG